MRRQPQAIVVELSRCVEDAGRQDIWFRDLLIDGPSRFDIGLRIVTPQCDNRFEVIKGVEWLAPAYVMAIVLILEPMRRVQALIP